MYEILIERTAERDLKSLPAGIFKRLVSRINALSENPRPPGSHKLAGSKNDWRIRVVDYRVVYDIDDPRKRVRISGSGTAGKFIARGAKRSEGAADERVERLEPT